MLPKTQPIPGHPLHRAGFTCTSTCSPAPQLPLAQPRRCAELIKTLLRFSTANRQNVDFNHGSHISPYSLCTHHQVFGVPMQAGEKSQALTVLHKFPLTLEHQLKPEVNRADSTNLVHTEFNQIAGMEPASWCELPEAVPSIARARGVADLSYTRPKPTSVTSVHSQGCSTWVQASS